MSYIQFQTEEDAEFGQAIIFNLGVRVLSSQGYDVDENGRLASGVKDGIKVPSTTDRWDAPRQADDGLWYVLTPSKLAFYSSKTPGQRLNLYTDLGLSTVGLTNDIVLQTGEAWLAEIWPLVGLGAYNGDHNPTFPE